MLVKNEEEGEKKGEEYKMKLKWGEKHMIYTQTSKVEHN